MRLTGMITIEATPRRTRRAIWPLSSTGNIAFCLLGVAMIAMAIWGH